MENLALKQVKENKWSPFLTGLSPCIKPKLIDWFDVLYDYMSQPTFKGGDFYMDIAMFPVLRRVATNLYEARCLDRVKLTNIERLFEVSKVYVKENYERILKLKDEKFNGRLDIEATLVSGFAEYVSNILISKCNDKK